jgi:cardiolipin synthase A/B
MSRTMLETGNGTSDWLSMFAAISLLVHVTVVVGLVVRVIMRRPPVGVACAWLLLIMALPYVGAVIYLLVGERRIGRGRARKLQTLGLEFHELTSKVIRPELLEVDWSRHRGQLQAMGRLGQALAGARVVHGSRLELLADTEQILTAIARDIDASQKSVLMEFYIWNPGGLADEVLEALVRASGRGVRCLVLIDALGARPWWKSRQPERLRAAGVELRAALPVGLLRMLIGRTDLRLHRKIVVIDGAVAWTGSMNMVDPRYFKQDAGVGQWVDAMARLEGAAVAALASTMLGDWLLETNESLDSLLSRLPFAEFVQEGTADVQVIRSGPGQSGDALLQMILSCVNNAERELVLTTPYLIPDESLLQALRGAAARGVTVRLLLPEKVDSFLTRHACRSYYDDLTSAGVRIHLYQGGLLHTKSIRVDGDLSMFGTANLDLRSLWLNYEVSLFVYDREFNAALARLQDGYLAESVELDRDAWDRRGLGERMLENGLRLVSPLL